jgi:hypothetical protein
MMLRRGHSIKDVKKRKFSGMRKLCGNYKTGSIGAKYMQN